MKNINDSLGHADGDRALQDAAGILRATFRDSDIFARMGGNEFVVLALRNTPQAPESTIARLQEDLDRFNQMSGRPYTLSIECRRRPAGTGIHTIDRGDIVQGRRRDVP